MLWHVTLSGKVCRELCKVEIVPSISFLHFFSQFQSRALGNSGERGLSELAA